MNSGSDDFFDQYSQMYDVCAGRNGKKNDDVALYRSFGGSSRSLLEIGCGTGRVLVGLDGFFKSIDGVDSSAHMIERARQKSFDRSKISLYHMDAIKALPDKKYDVILVSWFTLNYILRESDRLRLLALAFSHLRCRGVLLLDLFFPKLMRPGFSADEVWTEKKRKFKFDGGDFFRSDKRWMVNDIEHREQVFHFAGNPRILNSKRRYLEPKAMVSQLEDCGFDNIQIATKYEGFLPYKEQNVRYHYQLSARRLRNSEV